MRINRASIKKSYTALALTLGVFTLSHPAAAESGSKTPPVFFGSMANYMRSPSSTALPVPLPGFSGFNGIGKTVTDREENKTTVFQSKKNAVAQWQSFDVGKDAWVHFDQQGNTDWKILNRIYDSNPSQIYGKITGDGSVYLINQNGIFFGKDSFINVHSLVGSALDIDTEDFLNNTQEDSLKFTQRNYSDHENWDPDSSIISNDGFISVELIQGEAGSQTVIRDGSVFLIAPHVENSGTIVAPYGQIGLAAGQNVELAPEKDAEYINERRVLVTPENAGYAVNRQDGSLVADNGRAGLYGSVVNQDGLIRSVTSVYHRGRIELRASEKVTTGIDSTTVTPVTTSDERTNVTFGHRPGQIFLQGLGSGDTSNFTGSIEHKGVLSASSGRVSMEVREEIILGPQSLIDVAGLWSNRSSDSLWFTQEMNSAQLKDDHLQKDGLIYRSEITVNELLGSTIGDFDEAYKNVELTSREKASQGGNISLRAVEGDIVIEDGALLDITGGGHINAGSSNTATKVVYGQQVYDISEAPIYTIYDGFADFFEKKHDRYGIVDSFSGLYYGGTLPLYDALASHVEGHDAGVLKLISRRLLFNGSLFGGVEIGPYQIYDDSLFTDGIYEVDDKQITEKQRRPIAGSLIIGGEDGLGQTFRDEANFVDEIVISHDDEIQASENQETVSQTQTADDSSILPFQPSYLPDSIVNNASLDSLTVSTNYRITVDKEAKIELPPGGDVNFTSRRIDHFGDIDVPSGTVSFTVANNETAKKANTENFLDIDEYIFLAENSRISVAGEKVNTWEAVSEGELPNPKVLRDGGSISLMDKTSNRDDEDKVIYQGFGVVVADNALLDVSGGYEITTKKEIEPGDAGDILISGSNVFLAGTLKGHSLPGAKGGTLSLFANNIDIVGGESASLSLGGLISQKLESLVDREISANLPLDPLFIDGLQEELDQIHNFYIVVLQHELVKTNSSYLAWLQQELKQIHPFILLEEEEIDPIAPLPPEEEEVDPEKLRVLAEYEELSSRLSSFDLADRENVESAKEALQESLTTFYDDLEQVYPSLAVDKDQVQEKVRALDIHDSIYSLLARLDSRNGLTEIYSGINEALEYAHPLFENKNQAELQERNELFGKYDTLYSLLLSYDARDRKNGKTAKNDLKGAIASFYKVVELNKEIQVVDELGSFLIDREIDPAILDASEEWSLPIDAVYVAKLDSDVAELASIFQNGVTESSLNSFNTFLETYDLSQDRSLQDFLSRGLLYLYERRREEDTNEPYFALAGYQASNKNALPGLKDTLTTFWPSGEDVENLLSFTDDIGSIYNGQLLWPDEQSTEFFLKPFPRGNEFLFQFRENTAKSSFYFPESQFGKGLIFNADSLKDSGFTNLAFNSVYDLNISDGVNLGVSYTKTSPPSLTSSIQSPLHQGEFYEEEPSLVGPSSLAFKAGTKLYSAAFDFDEEYGDARDIAEFILPAGSSFTLPPSGEIVIEAPWVTIDGTIEAPAGTITVTAKAPQQSDLIIGATARLLARGYNVPSLDKEIEWQPNTFSVLDGGTISLTNKTTGLFAIQEGAVLDVSGSQPVVTRYYNDNNEFQTFNKATNENQWHEITEAGASGSISLAFGGESVLEGTIAAHTFLPHLEDGSLSIVSNNRDAGFEITTDILDYYRKNDFHSWKISSAHSLIFPRNVIIVHDGEVVLDTPMFVNDNASQVSLAAHYLQLDNSFFPSTETIALQKIITLENPDDSSEQDTVQRIQHPGLFDFSADYIDVSGSVNFDMSKKVSLRSGHDIILTDRYYINPFDPSDTFYSGWLAAPGDLELNAARIYPDSFTDFTLYTGNTLTLLPGTVPSENILYSAGGSLSIFANRIDHRGYLTAPLGSLSLTGINRDNAQDNSFWQTFSLRQELENVIKDSMIAEESSRIMISADSVLSAKGQAYMISYGEIDEKGAFWTAIPKDSENPLSADSKENVTNAPLKSITLEGDEVLVREGANVDLAGGGGIFVHRFLAGIDGTKNPLLQKGQYLLVPNYNRPGQTLTIKNEGKIASGTYTLLELGPGHPENAQYAFLPGALVLIDQGDTYLQNRQTSKEGYPLISGYVGLSGGTASSPTPRSFAVRDAKDVLDEGFFVVRELTGGEGGSFTLTGKESMVTSIIEADIKAKPLEDFNGGTFKIAARFVEVGAESIELDPEFAIDDTLPAELQDKLIIKDSTFSGNGFENLAIGDRKTTRTVTFKENSTVKGRNILVSASSGYEKQLVKSSELSPEELEALGYGLDEENLQIPEFVEINVEAPGMITMEENALLEAFDDETATTSQIALVADTEGGFPEGATHEFTAGNIVLAETSLVRSNSVSLDSHNIDLGGDNIWSDTLLHLKTRHITFADEKGEGDGLFINNDQWSALAAIENIYLDSDTDVLFTAAYGLTADHNLTLDAQRIGGYALAEETSVAAAHLTLQNNKYESTSGKWLPEVSDLENSSSITFHGEDSLALGPGSIKVDGFTDTVLSTAGDLSLNGQARLYENERHEDVYGSSSLDVSGNLGITSARVILNPYYDLEEDIYKSADFVLKAADTLTINPVADGNPDTQTERGGRLTMAAPTLSVAGLIDTVSSQIILDSDDIDISGRIRSTGSDQTRAGSIRIKAANSFTMHGGTLDVSAGRQGDAGQITISAPQASSFSISTAPAEAEQDEDLPTSHLLAKALGGNAGSFFLDVEDLSGNGNSMDFDTLNTLLHDFTYELDIRSRLSDISVSEDHIVQANHLKMTADNGDINIHGTLDAAGDEPGSIDLNSKSDLNLWQGSLLTGANTVKLHSGTGWINLGKAIQVDEDLEQPVIAEKAAIQLYGPDATLSFRALRSTEEIDGEVIHDVKVNIDGEINGTDNITVEAVQVYYADRIEDGKPFIIEEDDNGDEIFTPLDVDFYQDAKDFFDSVRTRISIVDEEEISEEITSETFMKERLSAGLTDDSDNSLHIRPGIEIQSDKDLTLDGTWNILAEEVENTCSIFNPFCQPPEPKNWRFGEQGETMVLTLRAAGDLKIEGSIIDMPTSNSAEFLKEDYPYIYMLLKNSYGNYGDDISANSADINLIAGANTNSPDIMALNNLENGKGNLVIGKRTRTVTNGETTDVWSDSGMIYTETGDIHFASAGETVIGPNPASNKEMMPTPWYEARLAANLTTYRGDIKGTVGRNMTVLGTVQTASGDIAIDVANNLAISEDQGDALTGSIRTTGLSKRYGTQIVFDGEGFIDTIDADMKHYYDYSGGGSIALNIGGDIWGGLSGLDGWDKWWKDEKKWGAAYINNPNSTATPTLGIATMAGGDVSVKAGGDVYTQIGTFGSGDLTLLSRADMNGRFLNASGTASLYAMGNFGTGYRENSLLAENQQIELNTSNLELTAEGSIDLGALVSPSWFRSAEARSASNDPVMVGFSQDTSASLWSRNGDIRYTGTSHLATTKSSKAFETLPANLSFKAENNIVFDTQSRRLEIAPSGTGQIEFVAGNDILGVTTDQNPAQIKMRQDEPYSYYGWRPGSVNVMPVMPLHTGDQKPVSIVAGQDITNMRFILPKKAEILAGRDIKDLEFQGQNIDPLDVTIIKARHDIVLGSYERDYKSSDAKYSGFKLAGPGSLLVQAGNNIDLGTTLGIRTMANAVDYGDKIWAESVHPSLGFEGADIYVLAGLNCNISPDEVEYFFNLIRDYGKYYSLISATETLEDAGHSVTDQVTTDVVSQLRGSIEDSDLSSIENLLASFGADIQPDTLSTLLQGNEEDLRLFVEKLLQTMNDDLQEGEEITMDDQAGGQQFSLTAYQNNASQPAGSETVVEDLMNLFALHAKIMDSIKESDSPGSAAKAVELLARQEAIAPMFGTENPELDDAQGNVIMTQSQIATLYGGSVNILATGTMDVGYSFFPPENDDANAIDISGGIKTEFGGDINIYSVGDVNVNESRIMTWMGGDMTMWTEANINAGRGSKTAVNASGEGLSRQNEKGTYETFKKPSASGSGIRALTFDMDGRGGPREMPEPGDIYLFAPSGIIDAGEAGIVGGTIYLAATEVLNAQNITFSQAGVGVPVSADTSISLGAISGAGNIAAAAGEVTKSVAGVKEASQQALDQMATLTEDLKPRWVQVQILDLIDNKEDE
ncbi:MAG: filamentous hemagglutinin family protein [Desulfobulbaceae bacterium]|nr:filamentous hemagglutinin family protein [Desulfobulbaceae bacterium]